MAKATAKPRHEVLLIGLNSVNPKHYDDWDGKLNVCEADVECIASLLKKKGFTKVTKLLTKQATRKNVLKALDAAAKTLKGGDLFFVYYSGHGGNEIPDTNKDEDDEWNDQYDETWCLFDAQLIDDELYNQWKKFQVGVRILVVSDSCFSGDIAKIMPPNKRYPTKAMPKSYGHNTYEKNKAFYNKILRQLESKELKNFKSTQKTTGIKATLLQISSSQEYQESRAETDIFPSNSLFTAVLDDILKKPKTKIENYKKLISYIKKRMPEFQTPKEQLLGDKKYKILLEKPFSI